MRFTALMTIAVLLPLADANDELGKPVRIVNQNLPHAAPFLADVNNDGKQDLLDGLYRDDPYTGARVKLFRNIGTEAAPKFGEGEFQQAGGNDATCDEFCYTGFGPQIVDFNGDNINDLITGSRDCQLYIFDGRRNRAFGTARRVTYVPHEKTQPRFRYNSRIFAYDWDNDGDQDLLSARNASIWLIRNDGDANTPLFAQPEELVTQERGEPTFKAPVVADWNNDGRNDLLVARSDGSVAWHRNTAATDAEPALGRARQLIGAGVAALRPRDDDGAFESPKLPTSDIRLCVADFNSDGRLDLIIGDAWMVHGRSARRTPDEVERSRMLSREESKLRGQLRELSNAPLNESEVARQQRELRIRALTLECAKIWRERNTDSRSSRHGSVWFMQRLAVTTD
ncbi:MAG: VCBS repeat-containing protein [Fuerstiella sp.]